MSHNHKPNQTELNRISNQKEVVIIMYNELPCICCYEKNIRYWNLKVSQSTSEEDSTNND